MIDQGYRLACQARLQDDMRICIVNPEPSVSWKPIRDDEYIPVSYSHQKAAHSGKPLGVAVDLGTTHICLTLWDMAAGKRLAGVSGRNPQARFGVDVLTWLVAACESQERSQEMGQIVREAIAEAIRETVSQTACKTHDIRHVAIVGNTGMLALLTGKNHTALLQPELWMQETDILPEDTRPWCLSWGIDPAASIHVIPPLGGFVGSDISRVSWQHIWQTAKPRTGHCSLILAPIPRSPCGTEKTCGSPPQPEALRLRDAESPGAIFRIEADEDSAGFEFEVIGDGQAKGICGSGLVDDIACLITLGMLKENGNFSKDTDSRGLALSTEHEKMFIKKRDIDAFQRAKGAIGAGVRCLLKTAGIGTQDIRRVCVCGVFAKFLNVANAQSVGLLPDIPTQHVELCGNTVLSGYEMLLLDGEREEKMASLKNRCKVINLAQAPEYEDLFIENLFLRPMRME